MRQQTIEEWHQLSALYEQADELDGAALTSWLNNLRAQQHALLPQLERMLNARTQVRKSDFLVEPATLLPLNPLQRDDWSEGQTVGPYKLLRPLGSGGMAEVWLAKRDDGAFEREVAVKLLYRDSHRSRRSGFMQRFERERNILASLNHRHIAKLLDAGITAGNQPWIALEYVQGQGLIDWCNQARLTVRARVSLFMQVLLAIQYAHSNLVIHRDIKPANILVTEQGQVQLLDFGIAKILESDTQHSAETELTQVAGRPLTLQYASPEQTRGETLTTASDIYSLGVVLYQLLCGATPYELKHESAAQLELAIHEFEPRPPSRRTVSELVAAQRQVTPKRLQHELSSDLDAIVLKALRKQPQQRYSSVEALHQDLQRWLDGLAVEAKPPSSLYYARKFVARHRVSVGLGSAALISLLVGASVSIYLGLQAREQSERASASRDFLINMFRQADPDLTGGRQVTAGELLAAAKASLLADANTPALVRAELLHGLGTAQFNMGQYKPAAVSFAESQKMFEQTQHPKMAHAVLTDRALAYYNAGDRAGAQLMLEQFDACCHVADQSAEVQANYFRVRGSLAEDRQDLTTARDAFQKYLEVSQSTWGDTHRQTVMASSWLAKVDSDLGDYAKAAERLTLLSKHIQSDPNPNVGDLINVQDSLAELDFDFGNYAASVKRYADTAAYCEKNYEPRGETCTGLRNMQAVVLLAQGFHQQAASLLPNLLVHYPIEDSPVRSVQVLQTACRIVNLNALTDQYPQVCTQWDAAFAPSRNLNLPQFIYHYRTLAKAEMLLKASHAAEVVAMLADYPHQLINGVAPSARAIARAWVLTAMAQQMQGQHEQAVKSFAAAYEQSVRSAGEAYPPGKLILMQQAYSLCLLGHTAQAKQVWQTHLPIISQAYGPDSPVVAKIQRWSDKPPAIDPSSRQASPVTTEDLLFL